jgi:hypothetical protein
METNNFKTAEFKEFLRLVRKEIQDAQRPASEIILDDEDVMRLLKISKRKLQYLKANSEIPYYHPRPGNRTYYKLSDILNWLNQSRVESLGNNRKI